MEEGAVKPCIYPKCFLQMEADFFFVLEKQHESSRKHKIGKEKNEVLK